jgi:hypothetical protein
MREPLRSAHPLAVLVRTHKVVPPKSKDDVYYNIGLEKAALVLETNNG